MKEKIDKAVKKHFKPEFINRLDGIVIFRAFDKPHLIQVVDLEVEKLQKRLMRKGISVTLSQESKEFLVERGYQPEMGARPLRRAVEQNLEDPLAEMLLRNPNMQGTCHVVIQDGAIKFNFEEKVPVKDESKMSALALTKKKREKEPEKDTV
jgi:ATP-dependent Clp protease ATP-binding subunit ClpC